MSEVKNRKLLIAAAVLVVVAVVAAACGGAASEGTPLETPAATVPNSPAPDSTDASEAQSQVKKAPPTTQDKVVATVGASPDGNPPNPPLAKGDQGGFGPTPQERTAVLPTPKVEEATPTPTPRSKKADGPEAPEITGIHAWINSAPLKISELRGKVVLIDIWTYTCVNCIRTFPYLKLWHSKYADDGLVIIGVHSPEFTFEQKLENVQEAVKRYGIGWAVALDNDHATWDAYDNRYWPAKYLIDKDGVVRFTHFGEGAYVDMEMQIRELLKEAGADLTTLDFGAPNFQPLDPEYLKNPSARPTRELYAGWRRGYNDVLYGFDGYVGDRQYYQGRDAVVNYQDPDEHRTHLIYLQGPWHNGPESLRHGRETPNFEDYMFLRFSAKSVNAVIKPEGEGAEPFKVLVTLDGEYLTDSNKGEDVVIEEDGRSFLHVNEPKLYSIIQAPKFGTYDLKLSSNSPNFALFAFTFGVYESGV